MRQGLRAANVFTVRCPLASNAAGRTWRRRASSFRAPGSRAGRGLCGRPGVGPPAGRRAHAAAGSVRSGGRAAPPTRLVTRSLLAGPARRWPGRTHGPAGLAPYGLAGALGAQRPGQTCSQYQHQQHQGDPQQCPQVGRPDAEVGVRRGRYGVGLRQAGRSDEQAHSQHPPCRLDSFEVHGVTLRGVVISRRVHGRTGPDRAFCQRFGISGLC